MKNLKRVIFGIIVFLFTTLKTFAQQPEKESYKSVIRSMETFYNLEKYDSIFSLFSPEMKTAMPLEKTIAFLTGLQKDAGKILKRTFEGYENGAYAVYQTTFENNNFNILLSVDNEDHINGLFIKPLETAMEQKRNSTKLVLPFKGEWMVVWGGDTKELNYHVKNRAQKNAFDIIQVDSSGKSYRTDGKTNEDYYAFGKEILAPCNGKVVQVVHGVKDNIPGEMNIYDVGGNTVILQTAQNEFLVFCHFKHASIRVQEGQDVTTGQVLGLCGNTGNSSEPHLHFHMQDVENMNKATGIKCYFDKILVNGVVKEDYSPIQNDKVQNIP